MTGITRSASGQWGPSAESNSVQTWRKGLGRNTVDKQLKGYSARGGISTPQFLFLGPKIDRLDQQRPETSFMAEIDQRLSNSTDNGLQTVRQ